APGTAPPAGAGAAGVRDPAGALAGSRATRVATTDPRPAQVQNALAVIATSGPACRRTLTGSNQAAGIASPDVAGGWAPAPTRRRLNDRCRCGACRQLPRCC